MFAQHFIRNTDDNTFTNYSAQNAEDVEMRNLFLLHEDSETVGQRRRHLLRRVNELRQLMTKLGIET